MFRAMAESRTPSLLIWLAAVLLVALGVAVPGAASAHAGHEERPARTAAWNAMDTGAPAAPLVFAAAEAIRGEVPPGVAMVSPGDETASAPCGGAACCTAGHGCCSAIPVLAPATPALPRASRLAAYLAGLPPGISAPALPEPPRPFR